MNIGGEVEEDYEGIPDHGDEHTDIVLVVELAYAYVEEDAVMVELVDAALAFVAVPHADPFEGTAGVVLTDVLFCVEGGRGAVGVVTGGVVDEDEVVAEKGEEELVVGLVGPDEGDEDEQVV